MDDLENQQGTSSAIGEFTLELQSGNAQFGSKYFPRVTLKCDRWPWKSIEYPFYITSSFVHHFVAISEFNEEVKSGNAQFGENHRFLSRATLKFDGSHWKPTGQLLYATSSFVTNFVGINEFKLELEPGNSEFGWKLAFLCACEIWQIKSKQ